MGTYDPDLWLTHRLGETVSTSVRNVVRSLVIDGDWDLDDVTDWRVTLVRHDDRDTRQILEIWLQSKQGGTRGLGGATWWTMAATSDHMHLEDLAEFVAQEAHRG